MNQPLMTTPEYLQTEEGKAFARRFLSDLLLQPAAPRAAAQLDDFETLLHEYIEHLAQDLREYHELTDAEEEEQRRALTEVYKERFDGFKPPRDRELYITSLTRLARWLAAFTCEAWLIATGQRKSAYEPQVATDHVRAMHLYWGREAFGWYLANLSKLPYLIKIRRLPKRGMANQLAAIVAGDPQLSAAVERLSTGVIEVDDGCPLC